MARNTTITREAVFEAADELAVQLGKPPTQSQVRDALGGGSFSTIGPLVKEWELARSEQIDARDTDIPEAVQAALAEVAGRLWKVASSEAALGVEAARREVEDMKRVALAEAASASEAIRIVEGEREAALEHVDSLTVDLSAARAELVKVQDHLREQSEARVRAEAQAEAAKDLALRADADRAMVHERVRQFEAEAVALRETVSDQRAQLAQLGAERAGLVEQLSSARDATKDADARTIKADARADHAEARAEAAQIEMTKTAAELATVRAELAKESAEHAGTRSQLSERLEHLSVKHERAEDLVKALQAKLEAKTQIEQPAE